MALKEVLKQNKRLFVDWKEEIKHTHITESLLSLKLYKERELSFKRRYKLRNEALNSLIVVVYAWVESGSKSSIDSILKSHGYTKSSYYMVYNRIERLYKKGLVECDKVLIRNVYVNYFYPTELGLKGVYGLLIKEF